MRGTKTDVLTVLLPLLQNVHTGNVTPRCLIAGWLGIQTTGVSCRVQDGIAATAAEVIGIAVVRSRLRNYKFKTSDR